MESPPKIESMPTEKQTRLDQLLNENSEGTISEEGKLELDHLVAEAEQLMVQNARRLAEFAENEAPTIPSIAMPVTVWVKPQSSSN